MEKALSGELSCPCDRSCYIVNDHYLQACVCEGGGGVVGGRGNKEGKLVVHDFFWSTSGPISNRHYVTNLTLKCVCINNKKRKLLHPFLSWPVMRLRTKIK